MEGVPDDAELTLWLLGDIYRIWAEGRDRRVDGPHVTNAATGLPESATDLRPDSCALRGDALALQQLIQPRQWARVHMGLWAHPEATWSPDAVKAVEETAYKIGRVIRSLAAQGYMDEEPALLGYEPMGPDPATGWCSAAVFTVAGLEYAKRTIKGTKYEHGAVSVLAELPAERQSEAPEWARAEWARESRA